VRRRKGRGWHPRHGRGHDDRCHRPEPARPKRDAAQRAKDHNQRRRRGEWHLKPRTSTRIAASATPRRVSARRSSKTAAMIKAHSVPTLPPDSIWYPAPAIRAQTAAIYFTGSQPGAHDYKDGPREQPHTQLRNRQQMRPIGRTQRGQAALAHAGPVSGDDGGGKGSDLVRQMGLNGEENCHASSEKCVNASRLSAGQGAALRGWPGPSGPASRGPALA
jgi:hypothetical protein